MSDRWPIVLAHHHPEDAERCARVGGVPVCRRCLAMWPLSFLVMGLGLFTPLPAATDVALVLWMGPPVGEYLATHLGRAQYSARRTWVFGVIAGIAVGRLFHRYLMDPMDRTVWLVAFMGAAPTFLGALYATYERSE